MRFSTFIIAILLFGVLVTGTFSFFNDLSGADAFNTDVDDYSAQFDHSQNLSTEIADRYGEMSNWTSEKSSAIQIITLVPDALMLAKDLILLPVTIVYELLDSLVNVIGLPDWITTFALAVIVVFVIFGFIALILRYRET